MTAPFPDPDPFTQEATVSAWVRADVLPSKAGRIFHITGKSGFAKDLDLQIEQDDHFRSYVATGAPHTAVSKMAIEAGTWYRVDATYRAKDIIVLYVDRVPEASVPIPGVTRDANAGPITVGENATFHGRFCHGLVDEVPFAIGRSRPPKARRPVRRRGPRAASSPPTRSTVTCTTSRARGMTVSSLARRGSRHRARPIA
jgi:hypothetical protein